MSLRKFKHAFTLFLMKSLAGLGGSPAYMAYTGSGSAAELCRHITRTGVRKLLLVTDKPLRDLGIVDQATAALADTGVENLVLARSSTRCPSSTPSRPRLAPARKPPWAR